MYKLITYSHGHNVYKTKIYTSKPTFSQINKLVNRWSLVYGAHLNSELIEIKA